MRGFRLRPVHALAMPVAVVWAWVTIYEMGSMLVAGISTTLLLSDVTISTGVIFWRGRARMSSGAAPVLANSPKMFELARQSGRRIVEMVWEDLKPRDVMTPAAFHNAVAAVLAVSGSINCVKHLQAIATEVDVPTKLSPQLRSALLSPLAQYGAAAKPRHRGA